MAQRDPQEPVYMIGVAAQLTGLHPQTVRLYERLGFVYEGAEREAWWYDGMWHDQIFLSMLEHE